jgi:MFS family permease
VTPGFGQARAAELHDAVGGVPGRAGVRAVRGRGRALARVLAGRGDHRRARWDRAALGSALSPSFWVLIAFRFLLGFGVGSDYPVSAVLMSEHANRKDCGRLVGMVFSTQA